MKKRNTRFINAYFGRSFVELKNVPRGTFEAINFRTDPAQGLVFDLKGFHVEQSPCNEREG